MDNPRQLKHATSFDPLTSSFKVIFLTVVITGKYRINGNAKSGRRYIPPTAFKYTFYVSSF